MFKIVIIAAVLYALCHNVSLYQLVQTIDFLQKDKWFFFSNIQMYIQNLHSSFITRYSTNGTLNSIMILSMLHFCNGTPAHHKNQF